MGRPSTARRAQAMTPLNARMGRPSWRGAKSVEAACIVVKRRRIVVSLIFEYATTVDVEVQDGWMHACMDGWMAGRAWRGWWALRDDRDGWLVGWKRGAERHVMMGERDQIA